MKNLKPESDKILSAENKIMSEAGKKIVYRNARSLTLEIDKNCRECVSV